MQTRATDIEHFMDGLISRNPGEVEFHQAVHEVASDIIPWMQDHRIYAQEQVLERLCEPDRIISFRVCWHDDNNNIRVNRGYRIQNNNAIGPYKGGLRFHTSVNQSILKFLAFEQTFKNSLTGLPMGGGKGGADFNPRGKSDHEIMRFCQSFMTELYRHVGEDIDVPAGDIGVGGKEIGYMFGQYKRITNQFTGVLTGKGLDYGGSAMRTEATGYGCVYFLIDMLKAANDSLEGKTVLVSGSGNVATYAAEQALLNGAKILTMSDSDGFVYDKNGFTQEKIDWVKDLKIRRRGRISEYAEEFGAEFHQGSRPWGVSCDVALPCATQNEIEGHDAKTLIANGCMAVSEGANMPTLAEGVKAFLDAKVLFAPAKAANAGGVAMSGLEMSQNAGKRSWGGAELSVMLREIMLSIHDRCYEAGNEGGYCNYAKGANIAGFKKVGDAVLAFGVV
ncbi:NADP-specific glutamate dehydrogenase [Granulosicoccus antarcticus]|uniref:Glutamate dehydrogenase n=1 Tax=Granulosicoccus antarcticus IMCC3135 TaxID=1192854 RepID=A0A2Z2NW56_9GAMM|nr:NADP-specific glutamate dehydrogenase [Granulosicoccus antarcticus]ASJ74281.1 NAD(P)-specific glutamate dehydrogenase [Granulosicoccus antarcticus IMCC3135]